MYYQMIFMNTKCVAWKFFAVVSHKNDNINIVFYRILNNYFSKPMYTYNIQKKITKQKIIFFILKRPIEFFKYSVTDEFDFKTLKNIHIESH